MNPKVVLARKVAERYSWSKTIATLVVEVLVEQLPDTDGLFDEKGHLTDTGVKAVEDQIFSEYGENGVSPVSTNGHSSNGQTNNRPTKAKTPAVRAKTATPKSTTTRRTTK